MRSLRLLFCAFTCALSASAALQRQTIEYSQGDTVLEGVLVYDDQTAGRRPGVLVLHQWKGLGDYEIKRAEMLAGLGYVAFCADVYGKGVRAKTPEEAAGLAGRFKEDRALLRARVNAACDQLRRHRLVNGGQVAAIGYCFGGTAALELARSGANLSGVVSFHGGLATPTPADARHIKARILALHGADDPFVPLPEVEGFMKEMRDGGVDWQLVAYGGAVHSFTDWGAGGDNSRGAAYNAKADARSWEAMRQFFSDLFR